VVRAEIKRFRAKPAPDVIRGGYRFAKKTRQTDILPKRPKAVIVNQTLTRIADYFARAIGIPDRALKLS
jgi:hypothetical protein